MNNSDRIFRVIAVAALGVGVLALIRREVEIKVLKDTHDLIRTYIDDEKFADIVRHYDDEGDV